MSRRYRERVVDPEVRTRPVGRGQIPELATLFDAARNTRRCWCMAPCVGGLAFRVGWVTGSNQRRFTEMADGSPLPMGVLASVSTEPVGWCATGPQSRYLGVAGTTDDAVWLVPCFVVHPDHRSRGVSHALLRAAVEVATHHGATAIEGRPAPGPEPRAGDAFRGRESLFAELGFTHTASGSMRLDLTGRRER